MNTTETVKNSGYKFPENVAGKNPTVVEFNPKTGKLLKVQVGCIHSGCNEVRIIKSQDLFQVRFCAEHQKMYARAAVKAAKAAKAGSVPKAPVNTPKFQEKIVNAAAKKLAREQRRALEKSMQAAMKNA